MFDSNQPGVEFRLVRWQRTAGYMLAGTMFSLAMALFCAAAMLLQAAPLAHLSALVLCAIGIWALSECYWKLRVDKLGIWQRRALGGWDQWPWADFADGNVDFDGVGCNFVDRRSSPRSPRRLYLSGLSSVDRQQLLYWIELVWQPTQAILPNEITIEQKGVSARFNSAAIELIDKGKTTTCVWTEVERLEIVRRHHNCDDFKHLTLKLADRQLFLDSRRVNWRGPTDDMIARFLATYVPEEKQFVRATIDPPRTLHEASVRTDEAIKQVRAAEKARTIAWFVVLVIVDCYSFLRDVRLLIALVYVAPMAVAVYFGHRSAQQNYEKLLQWQHDLEAEQRGPWSDEDGRAAAKTTRIRTETGAESDSPLKPLESTSQS